MGEEFITKLMKEIMTDGTGPIAVISKQKIVLCD